MEDPMEAIVAQALTAAGVGFSRDLGGENPSGLDFRLCDGVEIEVKRFHTPRIADQMARAENVIAIQGKAAVEHYAALHTALAAKEAELAAAKTREAKLREALAEIADMAKRKHTSKAHMGKKAEAALTRAQETDRHE